MSILNIFQHLLRSEIFRDNQDGIFFTELNCLSKSFYLPGFQNIFFVQHLRFEKEYNLFQIHRLLSLSINPLQSPVSHTQTQYIYIYIYIYKQHIYIYIYIYIFKQHFFVNANFIKHNRHFMSTYFLLDPFEFPYYFYRIRGELIYVLSIVVCIPSIFCPTLGHHQGRIYKQLHHFCNRSSPDDGPKSGRKY